MSEQQIIYLDNAATTFPKPEAVYQEMDSFYRQYGGNAGRGANPLARKAASLVEETRGLLSSWLQVPEIVFSPSSTIALNLVIFGARLRAGDIVYLTPFEHNSILRPIDHLRKTIGIELRVIPFDKTTFECDLNQLSELFRIEPPTMICISQVSNVFGFVLPIDDIIVQARQVNPNVISLVDGTQAAGLLSLNTNQIDAMVFSGHKSLYGPYGVAGIGFGRSWRPIPLIYGGTGTQSESIEMPLQGSSRYEAGSQNIVAIAGLNAALRWLNEIGREAIHEHTCHLTQELRYRLLQIPNVRAHIPEKNDSLFGIISFTMDGVPPQAVETALGAQGIAVRAGLHCSPWAHRFVGTIGNGGTVRVSVGFFNTPEMISKLNQAINTLQ